MLLYDLVKYVERDLRPFFKEPFKVDFEVSLVNGGELDQKDPHYPQVVFSDVVSEGVQYPKIKFSLVLDPGQNEDYSEYSYPV